ncbi:Uncharacterised protein [Mycobacteroides abscessus subsp. abscessus]|nr:Uncharacterised protein [Mycobacteroides abscessus subsp. abscessus]SHU49113.1 Uncharacterised protein [Mycobacteroides abscessus subsp. abscessus]SIG16556.1 Uncharacterised protein [Mycobacteroides abscessus subsp. abscessus]SIH18697.1 Uncharacterised protein [Mycobacteroides abscessus subsp. abscessus]SIL57794.1 Uncharacterised protein [Mycobacteroides abscessus subsp. abscessus]
MATVGGMELSGRYLRLLDTYEEYLVLRDMLNRIDEVLTSAERRRVEERPLFTVRHMHELYAASPYIEVSFERQREAERALVAAVEAYRKTFHAVTRGREEVTKIVVRQGLPYPMDLEADSRKRPALLPWWQRVGRYQWRGGEIFTERPIGDRFQPMNSPDPTQAIEIERNAGRREITSQQPT